MRRIYALWALPLLLACGAAATPSLMAQTVTDQPRLTGPDDFLAEVPAPQLARPETDRPRRMRAYPEQPPTIPHDIEGYELSVNFNKCLTCHKRTYTPQSGAPMISVTHYQDRDGQMLAGVSRRRYFCTQCHVPQTDARPLVPNTFTDMSRLTGENDDAGQGAR
jgi:cytochrome c-type protein NapB